MKSKNTFVRALIETISSEGDYVDLGCSATKTIFLKQRAYGLGLDKNVCVVSGWHILTIQPKDIERSCIKDLMEISSIKPSFMVADYVLEDDSGRFSEGAYIRTSFMIACHENCLFETENSIYVLVGTGTKSIISVSKAEKLFGRHGLFRT